MIRHEQVDGALGGVDADAVSVLDQGNRAAVCRFGADMADAKPRVAPEKGPSVMSATLSPIP